MSINLFYFMLLGLVNYTIGELNLQINKKTDDTIYPVASNVDERAGTTFSLVCELVSTSNEPQFDDQLSWVRYNGSVTKQFHTLTNDLREINKAEWKFQPLSADDRGKYICVSLKFNLSKEVEVVVRDEIKKEWKPRELVYCSEHMFQCVSNGLCIISHYVCDGKEDCKDGSDESIKQCTANPCKDKIPCDDGRCIPSAWCCDRHHDPNCTVNNRPTCCKILPDSYEEMELGVPNVTQTQHTAKYLFILVCVVSILFSVILLLLIISKVILFAKKTRLQRHQIDGNLQENIALHTQINANVIRCGLFTYYISRGPRVSDPLLFNPTRFNEINVTNVFDQPPSYVDVLQNERREPPPPYRSQEMINLATTPVEDD